MANSASSLKTTMAADEQAPEQPHETFEEIVMRTIREDLAMLALARKKEPWKHLISEHENEHSTH